MHTQFSGRIDRSIEMMKKDEERDKMTQGNDETKPGRVKQSKDDITEKILIKIIDISFCSLWIFLNPFGFWFSTSIARRGM